MRTGSPRGVSFNYKTCKFQYFSAYNKKYKSVWSGNGNKRKIKYKNKVLLTDILTLYVRKGLKI